MEDKTEFQAMHQTLKEIIAKNQAVSREPEDWNGYKFLPGMGLDAAKYAFNDWDVPEKTVFVSSFPKTGTAWCMEVVKQILFGRDPKLMGMYQALPMPMFLLEMGIPGKFETIKKLPHPRKALATHLPQELFNYEKMKRSNSKMIYVMRNPKDQAVSWFHFFEKLPMPDELKRQIGVEWDEFFNNYVQGKHPQCNKEGQWYPDHIKEWMKYKDDDCFLVVVYEDMKRDFRNEIKRIAKFLNVELDDDAVTKVVDVCSIKSMQKNAETEKSGFLKMNVRKGEVGGWKNWFTVAQSELMDALIYEKLGDTGIEFTYEINQRQPPL